MKEIFTVFPAKFCQLLVKLKTFASVNVELRTILVLEHVEHGQELPVIGNEGLTDVLSRADQLLQRLQCAAHDRPITGVQGY